MDEGRAPGNLNDWLNEDMDKASQGAAPMTRTTDASSHTWTQTLTSRLARAPVALLAEAIGKDDSTASRVRSGEARLTISEFTELLKTLRLQVVPDDAMMVDRDTLEATITLAQRATATKQGLRSLILLGGQQG